MNFNFIQLTSINRREQTNAKRGKGVGVEEKKQLYIAVVILGVWERERSLTFVSYFLVLLH